MASKLATVTLIDGPVTYTLKGVTFKRGVPVNVTSKDVFDAVKHDTKRFRVEKVKAEAEESPAPKADKAKSKAKAKPVEEEEETDSDDDDSDEEEDEEEAQVEISRASLSKLSKDELRTLAK